MPEGGFSFSHKKGQTFVPYNGKIADITHADTNKHTLTLANAAGTGAIGGETRKVTMVITQTNRIAGAGSLLLYPNEGTVLVETDLLASALYPIVIANGTQRLQYALTVAGSDFDLYCMGYVVEA